MAERRSFNYRRHSSPKKARVRAQDPPIGSLHDIILDYITVNAYAGTARALSRPRSGAVSRSGHDTPTGLAADTGLIAPIDVDMDNGAPESSHIAQRRLAVGRDQVLDQATLHSVEHRHAIINHVLNGAIMRAIDAIDTHFPSVLADPAPSSHNGSSNGSSATNGNGHTSSPPLPLTDPPPRPAKAAPSDHSLPVLPHSLEPSHVRLNLQIQQFIESFRQMAPSAPSTPSSSISSMTSSMHMSTSGLHGGSGVTLTNALTAAQGLHSEAKKMPAEVRAVYLQEIKDVGALFAYTDPETSILKGFLEQGRRIALAEQVNKAILRSEKRNIISTLDRLARRTTGLYSVMAQREVSPWPDGELPKEGEEWIASFWKRRPQHKASFKLNEYVGQTWY